MANLFKRLASLFSSSKEETKPKGNTFPELLEAFTARCTKWPVGKVTTAASPQRFGVLVTPWQSTAIPFFSLECARLIHRAGHTPVIFYDDVDLVQNSTEPTQCAELVTLVTEHFAGWEVRMAEQAKPQSYVSDITLAGPIYRENAIWRARGELRNNQFMADNPAANAIVTNHVGQVRGLIASANLDRLFIPGGILGLSAIYVALARELGIPFATYDGSSGLLQLSQNGVAAHFSDIPQAFTNLSNFLDTSKREKITAIAKAELDDRIKGRDHRHYQHTPATGSTDLSYDIVIPLNIRWESVALGKQRIFKTVVEWLDSVLTWVSERPELKVCIREHPREKVDHSREGDALQAVLDNFVAISDRLRFIPASEPVNTYDLIRQARVVLPQTSAVGVESVLLGKPVVLSSVCYYDSLGFCSKGQNRDEYFVLIQQALDGLLEVTPTQRDDAALAYYLTQKCAQVKTRFTAHPDDFHEWVQTPPDQLWAQLETVDFRAALLIGEPLSLIRHRRLDQSN